MRTTLDLPDSLVRQLKAKAASDGTTLKATIRTLLERELRATAVDDPAKRQPAPGALPTIKLGHPLNLSNPSNAALFELLDE